MTYFREVSDLLYQSQQQNRNSSHDYVRVKNLFRRAKIRDDLFQNVTAFTKYIITGEERPEQVAEKVYGSSSYDWIVLISNNILNIKNEWPLSNYEFNQYIQRKYTNSELELPHHYETTAVYDSKGKLIIPEGKQVDSNFSITYFDENIYNESSTPNSYYTFDSNQLSFDSNEYRFNSAISILNNIGIVTINPTKLISIYEYERNKNEAKRNIFLLRNKYLQSAIDDMKDIMSYQFSSQYVDDNTKKGEMLRVLSSR